MEVNVTARHCEVSTSFRDRVISEAQGLTKIYNSITSADVILDQDSGVHKAEVTVRLPQRVMNAKGKGNSLHQAYTVALEKAEHQIRKFKGKLVGRRGHREEKERDAIA